MMAESRWTVLVLLEEAGTGPESSLVFMSPWGIESKQQPAPAQRPFSITRYFEIVVEILILHGLSSIRIGEERSGHEGEVAHLLSIVSYPYQSR